MRLADDRTRTIRPLHSTRITELHRYYETVRPCAPRRYSAPRRFCDLGSSLAPPGDGRSGATGSHVPHGSLSRARAAFMPDTAWAVDRFLPGSSRGAASPSVSMSSSAFDTSSAVRSRSPSRLAPDALAARLFPATLSTPALDRRTSRWFAASSCKAAAEGPPPSPVQHCSVGSISYIASSLAFVTHKPRPS
jgi:hypothetical protein